MLIRIVCVLCVFVPVFHAEVLNEGLKEQSLLYGVALMSTDDGFSNTICRKHLKKFVDAVHSKEFWALRMLDASGQQESGYLFGHTMWLGSFAQCRDISTNYGLIVTENQRFPENAFPPYDTEFMTAALNHNNTMQIQFRIPTNEYIHLGLCMPKSCTTKELATYLDGMLDGNFLAMQHIFPVHMNVSGVKSLRTDEVNWMNDSMVQVTILIFSITLVLCAVGTWYDLFIYQPYLRMKQDMTLKEMSSDNNVNPNLQPPSLFGRVLLCYSIYTNTQSIFTTPSNSEANSGALPFVHGLKAWFMLYIVLLHGVLYQNFFTDNANAGFRMAAMMVNQVLSNASYSVDTYFCLGGFLISYIFYKFEKDRKPYKLIEGIKVYSTMIIHRYIRLTPAYAAILLTTYTLWLRAAQEYPLIHRVPLERVETACSQYWWRNLLYISTLPVYPREDMCMSWSWYLSNDMQFYIVNCMLLLVSTVYLKQILFILGCLPIVSIICGAVTSYIHKYVPTLEEQILQLEIMYDPFLIRMGPYFVGVLAGYYINKWNNTIPFSKSTISKISYTAFLNVVLIIHGVYTRDNLPITYIAVYMGLSRTLWGSSIAWLLMTCISGDAGLVNKFLSIRAWIPVSRLTYCLYLVHPIVIVMFGFTSDRGIHMSYASTIQLSVGTFAVSFVAALIISLLFESPYVLLLKIILGKVAKKNEVKN